MYNMEHASQQMVIAEANNHLWHNREKDLVDWWLWQSEGYDLLRTTEGERLIVLDSGHGNDGPGPDILNCHIIIEGVELCGNVEMHRHAKDWYSHKHHLDPHYASVILHVVFDERQGPDIPTLRLPSKFSGYDGCLASQPLSQNDILKYAFERFMSKNNHSQVLEYNERGYSPLLLGMFEILLAGSKRRTGLELVASQLGLPFWPDNKHWKGSNQSFPQGQSFHHIMSRILANMSLFDAEKWLAVYGSSWSSFELFLKPIQDLGISHNKSREWFVNIVAPYLGIFEGFNIWRDLPVFRHYGCENRLMQNLGLNRIETIMEQQGVLAWDLQHCRRKVCSTCPLTQSHQSLTQIN